MENATYASRLRYLDADDVDDAVVDYNGLDVRGPDGDSLGDVDGFIVDGQAGRVYYVVVDSGGWFSSNRMLLPIGHATIDTEGKALVVDVNRETLLRYPQFDEERFRAFSDEDLRAFESGMVDACCPQDVAADGSAWAHETRKHYVQPSWWKASYSVERLRPVESPATRAMATGAPPEAGNAPALPAREREVARDRSSSDDDSPHFDGRAQPGDILGIETGGERTSIGETAEAEDKRRRDAERTRPKD